ncbi:MAG: PAS domain S-box protein, partial [Spirochaetales bacterium]|nr:PAS domain S-box protein [Spirochaetales bacterium]
FFSVIVTAVSAYLLSSEVLRRSISQRNLQIARRASEEINSYLDDSFNFLNSLAEIMLPIKDVRVADIILENTVSTYGKFSSIHLLADDLSIQASSELVNSRASIDYRLLDDATAPGVIIVSDVSLTADGLPYLTMIAPILSADRRDLMVYANLQLRDIWDLVDDISFGASGQAFLVSAQNILIAHPDKTRVLSKEQDGLMASMFDAEFTAGTYFIARDEDGTRYLAAMDDIAILDWKLVIVQLLNEAFVPIQTFLLYSGLIAVVAIVSALIGGLLLVRTYSKPLSRLMVGTALIGEGNLRHRIQIETDDEFGKLSHSFNSMVMDLESWSEKLAVSERKYRLLTENANDIIFSLDDDGKVIYCNQQAVHVTGFTVEELSGRDITTFLSPESRGLLSMIEPGRESDSEIEAVFITKSGNSISLETKLVRAPADENTTVFYGVARDITERKKAGEQLQAYQQELRSLGSQLILAEARERKKIASLIHDRIGQALSISRIKLGILNSIATPGEETKIIGEIIPVIEEIIQDTRSLIFTISSPLLYDLGLGAALEKLVEQFDQEHPIEFGYSGPETAADVDTDIALLLFDAVKELLVNAVKHSMATSVYVLLSIVPDLVAISVRDNGKGFDVLSGRNGSKTKSGYGLFSIRERLDNLSGSCTIISGAAEGSEIVLRVPMVRQDTD